MQAFQNGQTFASLRISLFDFEGQSLKTYEWKQAIVVGYRQRGDDTTHSSDSFDQDLVFKSSSLTVSP